MHTLATIMARVECLNQISGHCKTDVKKQLGAAALLESLAVAAETPKNLED